MNLGLKKRFVVKQLKPNKADSRLAGKSTEALVQIISAAVMEKQNCHSQMADEVEGFDRCCTTLKKQVMTGPTVYVLFHSL